MKSTLLSIRTDEQTKKAVADFASSVGMSTSAFATVVLKQAVREGRVVLMPELEPTPYLEKLIKNAEADYEAGRNYVTVKNRGELKELFKSL